MLDYKYLTEQVATERNTPKHISLKLQLTALWTLQEPYESWPTFSRDTSYTRIVAHLQYKAYD